MLEAGALLGWCPATLFVASLPELLTMLATRLGPAATGADGMTRAELATLIERHDL